MKKIITAFLIMALPALGMAAGSSVPLMSANIDLSDKESLQRGAEIFINNCLNCHSAHYLRYNRMGEDLGMEESQVKSLMFATDKMGDVMNVTIDKKEVSAWFGTQPPDLSVIERFRGEDWLYTYFLSFYKDDSRPFGVNNTLFKDVGMPHVLEGLQGLAEPIIKTHTLEGGATKQVVDGLSKPVGGSQNSEEYERSVRDLVGFMVYMGEPAKLVRYDLGMKVIAFLIFLTFVLYLLKKEYWRDIH